MDGPFTWELSWSTDGDPPVTVPIRATQEEIEALIDEMMAKNSDISRPTYEFSDEEYPASIDEFRADFEFLFDD